MELPLLEGGTQMLGPRMGVHDGDCLAYRLTTALSPPRWTILV